MPLGDRLLTALRVNSVMRAFQDVRNIPQQLVFLNRTPVVPATDFEILARWNQRMQIADIIADDEKAVVYNSGKMKFETYTIPNIKHGRSLTQEEINTLTNLSETGGTAGDIEMFTNWERNIIDNLLEGIRWRMEAMIIASYLDTMSYDRLGLKMSGVSWGRPSDLKVTVATSWDTAATATPVSDILTVQRLTQVRYGRTYNRITMSLAAFIYMIATTEFQNKARTLLAPNVSWANLSTQNTDLMRQLAQNVIGMNIEFYDARYYSQDDTGLRVNAPFWPITKVLLSNTADDGNAGIVDWANAIVTESVVSRMVPSGMVGDLGGAQRGPVAYVTAPHDLNPPNMVYWGVARGFPRVHDPYASAVLTVGSFTDPITVVEPF